MDGDEGDFAAVVVEVADGGVEVSPAGLGFEDGEEGGEGLLLG